MYNRTPSQSSFAWIHILLGGLLANVVIACAPVGPDYQPAHQEMPTSWHETGVEDDGVAGIEELEHWWALFNDP